MSLIDFKNHSISPVEDEYMKSIKDVAKEAQNTKQEKIGICFTNEASYNRIVISVQDRLNCTFEKNTIRLQGQKISVERKAMKIRYFEDLSNGFTPRLHLLR